MTLRVGYFNMLRMPAPWWIKLLELFPQPHPLTMIEGIHYCLGGLAATLCTMPRTRSRAT